MQFKEVEYSEKPIAEVEKEIQKIEEKVVEKIEPAKEIEDQDVLSYFAKKGKKLSSLDELFIEKSEELHPTVAQLNKYIKETGRGIEDYLRLNKDYSAVAEDDLLAEYLLATEEGLDKDDVSILMRKYSFDEDVDDEDQVQETKLLRKKTLNKAKKFFDKQKEEYGKPIESMATASKELEDYKAYIEQSKTAQQEDERKREWFLKETDKVFSEFKGFEFTINDGKEQKKITFTPADGAELKKAQSTPMNFISKYLDEKGLIKDASGWHKALSMAMNPDKAAQFFFEQGQAYQAEAIIKGQKNINMSEQKLQQSAGKGVKFREVPEK